MNELKSKNVIKEQLFKNGKVIVKDYFMDEELIIVFRTPSEKEIQAVNLYTQNYDTFSGDFVNSRAHVGLYIQSLIFNGEETTLKPLEAHLEEAEESLDWLERVKPAVHSMILSLDFMDSTVYNICESAVTNFKSKVQEFVKYSVTGNLIQGFTEEDYDKYVIQADKKE